jgi:Sulfatase
VAASAEVDAADKPFFLYFAPGATHAPHHVPTEWADWYKGRFDQGWDQLREETLTRQLGVIPPDAELTARPEEIPAWEDQEEALKPVLAREMEVYAGYLSYAVGWAHAMDTPYQWTKQIASHWGGIRNGTIVHWPAHIQAKGELRHQFHHVIDVAPTVLEAASLPHPTLVNGVLQEPLHGVSMAYSFDDAAAAERHTAQYFEMLCNRGIYHKGWTAVTRHAIPWVVQRANAGVDDDTWELHGPDDWTQAHDLAADQPEKLAELQRLFDTEATKYNVLPLDPRFGERWNPDMSGRPTPVKGSSQLLFGGMHWLQENVVINTKNKSHSVTAEIQVSEHGAEGVIIAQGGNTGGWSLYAHQGRLTYCYNFVGARYFYTRADTPLPAGTHQVRMEFAYDGGGIGKGGTITLYVDGAKVADGRVERTHLFIFSMDETTEVGNDAGAPVSEDYGPTGNAFTGKVAWVQVDIDAAAADADHLIAPEERFRIAMAKQ